ncbi:hypothetical protein [Bdellovibrio svalbardensis]|uniref:Uncharacterized protein n=1 Tax=Bdellovibrio svalbardensis TaxID=2972972 RepID=A0ABT6DJ52_9BACT|nr:hypothetical protein [Bdellovibrio svalbardensis]MDG0816542.1 hypothetical protein [Bdellovibrio svalbardensis]
MAKIVKKKTASKPAAKAAASKPVKKAPAKAAVKPAPAKKAAPKTVVKKKVEKAPVKAAPKKPELKKKVEPKVEAKAKVAAKVEPKALPKAEAKASAKAAPAKPAKEVKAEAPKETAKKVEKKAIPTPVVVEKAASKKDVKAPKKGKGPKGKEKDETDLDDDFIADDDMMGDEIGEYEDELKAVEESEEEIEVIEEWTGEEKAKVDEEVFLTDAEGNRYCRARDCDQIAAVDVYCRYHYLMFWKKIQVRKKILIDGKLERYIEELTSRYPDKFLEMIRRDLRTEKDFLAAIQELELDESTNENEFEEDNSAFIEEVRGMGEGSGNGVEDDEY